MARIIIVANPRKWNIANVVGKCAIPVKCNTVLNTSKKTNTARTPYSSFFFHGVSSLITIIIRITRGTGATYNDKYSIAVHISKSIENI